MAAMLRFRHALALCLVLAASPSRAQPPAPAPARTLFVTVTDKQRNFIHGLRREDFVLHDGKRRQEPASLSQPDAPASVGILIDTSGSIFYHPTRMRQRERSFAYIRDALEGFLARSHPANDYFVVAFNQQPRLLVEGATDRAAVLAALGGLTDEDLKGQTALYDALALALEKSARGRHLRRVLLLITDGQDNRSRASLPKLKRALAESDVVVYVLGLASRNEPAPFIYAANAIVAELAEINGGLSIFPGDTQDLKLGAEYIAAELRMQYALSFAAPPSEKENGWHDLKVTLGELRDEKGKRLKYVVRTRRGFYDEGALRRNAPSRR